MVSSSLCNLQLLITACGIVPIHGGYHGFDYSDNDSEEGYGDPSISKLERKVDQLMKENQVA